jgi:hypothetical protein
MLVAGGSEKETGEAGEMWPHVARIRARAGAENTVAGRQARLTARARPRDVWKV